MSSSRNLFQLLPPPAECLALLIGSLEITAFGLGGLFNPVAFAQGYGLPLPPAVQQHPGAISSSAGDESPNPAAQQTQRALVAAVAARNIQNGLLIFVFGVYWRDRKALGTVVLAGLVTTLADTVLVKMHGLKGAIPGHVVGMVNSLAIGGSLLWWTGD